LQYCSDSCRSFFFSTRQWLRTAVLSGTWAMGLLSINVSLVSRHMIGEAGYAYVPTKSNQCRSPRMPGLAFHGLEDSVPDWIPCPCQPTIYCAIAPDLVTATCLAMQLDVSCLSLSSKAIEAAAQDNRKYNLVAIVAAVCFLYLIHINTINIINNTSSHNVHRPQTSCRPG
jgi:hypothetical protein